MLKRHKSIGVFIVYIDTGSSMQINPSESRDLADENNNILTEWKWFETTVFYKYSIVMYYINELLFYGKTGSKL
jgi:hypothetical protein